jgi:hypothetical protein
MFDKQGLVMSPEALRWWWSLLTAQGTIHQGI